MILNESSRDNLLLPYVEILKSKGKDVTVSQLKQFLLAKFVNEAYIRNLSLESNYYLAGVARYYFEGKLTENKRLNVFYSRYKDVFNREICKKLNALILVLRNSYIDTVGQTFEQPEDFGELPLEKLLRKYGSAIKREIANEPEEIQKKIDNLDRSNRVGNGYTFDILYSYSDARKYNEATEPGAWCITYGEHHYSYYRNALNIHYVIFAKDGYERIPRRKTEGWSVEKPQDAYGNSLIALLQSNNDWKPVYITSRWNHGSYEDDSRCEADHAYTTEEFMRITGVSADDLQRIYEIWKADNKDDIEQTSEEPNKKEVLRKFKYAQMKLNGGNFENLFGDDVCTMIKTLSNNKTLKDISEKIATGELSDEEVASLTKRKEKTIKNSVTLNKVTLFGFDYFFVRDGNKILFESIYKAPNNHISMDNMYASSDMPDGDDGYYSDIAKYKNNIISIARPSPNTYSARDASYYMLYDFRRHAFVEIEGVRKFKRVAEVSYYETGNGYYEIAQSMSQRALVDVKTNIPLTLPNGRCWFEQADWTKGSSQNYSREIRTNFYDADRGLIKITVDTSSGESYFYEMSTKKFFEPILPPENEDEESKRRISVSREWHLPKFCTILHFWRGGCSLYMKGKPVEINGEIFFNYINYTEGGYIFIIRPRGNKPVFVYDVLNQRFINLPEGVESDSISVRNSNFADNQRIIFDFGGYRNVGNIIYDCRFSTFIENPIYGGYRFKVYTVYGSTGEILFYKDNNSDTNLAYIGTLNPTEPKLDVKLDDNGEPALKKTTLYETKGSIYSIGINDIRNMILEIINKI